MVYEPRTVSPLASRAWTPEQIARRARDAYLLRHIRRGGSPHSKDVQLPKWLQEARP